MSKIAELLKLEAQKKAEKPKLEIVQTQSPGDSVNKSKQDEVSVSKSKAVEVRASRSKQTETSPTKNFTKTPNSTVKRAIPEKYFRGLSKHTYDVLWLQTRGAITPKRTVQLTKEELVKMTGLSKDAVKLHIKYLKESGLIKSHPAIGSRAGWEYEVFIIEEIEDGVSVSKSKEVSVSKGDENLLLPSDENLLPLTQSNLSENKGLSTVSKTFIKTNTNDDEAFGKFIDIFNEATVELTGKKLSTADQEKMQSLAELLVLELRTAARRTGSISNVPAFLTEVLRRQFFSARREQRSTSAKSVRVKLDTIGKSESETFEIKALDESGREAALEQLREFAGESFLEDFKKWYTEDDWQWLTENLKEKD